MKYIVAIVTAVLLFVLTACGAVSGDVYYKHYDDADVVTNYVQDYRQECTPTYSTAGTGTGGSSCRQVWVGSHPVQTYYPECYRIKFRNDEGDTGSDCISALEFDRIKVGDYYSKDGS